jgi:hypothetical protein
MVKYCSPFKLSGVVDSSFSGDHRRESQQIEDTQARDVRKGGVSSPATEAFICCLIFPRWKGLGIFKMNHQKVGRAAHLTHFANGKVTHPSE